jgi:hypothetical protein
MIRKVVAYVDFVAPIIQDLSISNIEFYLRNLSTKQP